LNLKRDILVSKPLLSQMRNLYRYVWGHILWVDRAFGPFWSYLNGYWSLYFSIFEVGLYKLKSVVTHILKAPGDPTLDPMK
jgi:hypothetical protein